MRPTRMSSTHTRMQTPEEPCLPAGRTGTSTWRATSVSEACGASEVHHPDGTAYRETNRFTVVDRPGRLAFESALTMPDGSTVRRDVDVTFGNEERGRTRMTIVQRGLATAEAGDAFGAGFPGIFERLERLAARWSRGKARS